MLPASTRAVELADRAFAHAALLGVATPSRDGTPLTGSTPALGARGWLEAVSAELSGSAARDPLVAAWIAAVRAL
jgi:hypothetical protein